MLLSLVTPTHKPTWLTETYQSLRLQSHEDWEWLLLLNGPHAAVPSVIRDDPRVRIVDAHRWHGNVGALKRDGFYQARGEGLIELDHDDLLMPGETLTAVAAGLAEGRGFVFSDAAVVKRGQQPHRYAEQLGWEHYLVRLYGRPLWAARNFEVTPRSLCDVGYAPDHLRAWHRDVYHAVGGHDLELVVGDDHDLICRTYLAKAPFLHTGGCHYVYRWHADNTVRHQAKQIQEQVARNRRKYIRPLIAEWIARRGFPRVALDDLWRRGWRFHRDLFDGFGAPDGTIGEIACTDRLQHCPQELCTAFFNRCWEALRPGGYLTLAVYSGDGRGTWFDHAAVSHHNRTSWLPYVDLALAARNPEIACRFQLVESYDEFPDQFHRDQGLAVTYAVLSALKGQRQPGPQRI